MDQHSEMIWQRGSARQIMETARQRFADTVGNSPANAHVVLASVHYSLIKRYKTWWQFPLAAWHMWRATTHANAADDLGSLGYNQVDVVSRILAKVPWWLGGDLGRAKFLIERALDYIPRAEPMDEMKPHARALMLITLGDIEYRRGEGDQAWEHYREAEKLVHAIEQEDSEDSECQLARVLAAVGFFYWDHGGGSIQVRGVSLLRQALGFAQEASRDQEEKILAGCRKRSIHGIQSE